jgi:hypothetical protein
MTDSEPNADRDVDSSAEPVDAPKPQATSRERSPAVELAIGAAVLLGIRAGLELLDGVLSTAPLASVVIGALLVDVVAGRAGLVWSDVDEPAALQARRAGLGAAAGLLVFGVLVAIAAGLGWARFAPGHPDGMILLTLVGGGATAVRDELLLRGLPLMYAARAGIAPRWAVLFAAAMSPALLGADPALGPGAVALALGSGLFFACAYRWAGGATAAIGAHAAWLFAVGPLAKGVFEIGWTRGDLGDGVAAAGAPAFVAAVLFALLAAATPRLAARFGLELVPRRAAAKPKGDDDVSPRRPRPARSAKAPSRKSPSSP